MICKERERKRKRKEMARLIDCLVDECNQLGIKLEPSEYIQSLIEGWDSEQQKEKG